MLRSAFFSRLSASSTSVRTTGGKLRMVPSTQYLPRPSPGRRRLYATGISITSKKMNEDPAAIQSRKLIQEGTSHLENGDLEKAKVAYERSFEIMENASALFNIGICHYHDRDLDRAIEAWKRALELDPESADVHTNLASAYVLSKPSRPDLAIAHLKTAASITPEDPEIQYNLAAVLEACEQLEEALIAYKRALKGGVQRSEQNIRNCSAKLLAARVAVQEQQEKEEQAEKEAASKGESS